MRVIRDQAPMECSEELLNEYHGTTQVLKTTRNTLYALSSRPDIRVNPKDSYGFRQPSPYSGEFVDYQPASLLANWHTGTAPTRTLYTARGMAGSFSYIFGNVLPTASNWENSLKSQALGSIKDQRVNLSMTLAFLPQTLRMIRGNFSIIGSVLKSAQRRDWENVRHLLKIPSKVGAASFYLELLFGWLQLLRDTQGIVEELHRKCNKPEHTFVYGRASRIEKVPQFHRTATPSNGWHRPGIFTYAGQQNVDHRLVMIFRGETALLSRLSQLGLTNPAELVWDLVPWSWVVSMGVSIGEFVRTLDATIGLTYLGGTYTQYRESSGIITVAQNMNIRNPGDFSSTPGRYRETRFDRKVIDDKVDPFVLKNPFSSPIAITAAVVAAVVQLGGRHTPQPPRGATRTSH